MSTLATTPIAFAKEIAYDYETRDYACYLDGELVCFARTYHEAEITLDQLRYELLTVGQCATTAELDSGASVEEIAADHAVLPLPLVADPIGECYVCGDTAWERNVHGPLCPSHAAAYSEWQRETNPHPILAPALLDEADAALSHCPGAFEPCGAEAHPSYAPFCQRCARVLDRLAVEAYIQRLAEDAGLACAFCGEAHDAAECPLRRPLAVPGPRVCRNCGGAHSIQRCGELRAALFAEPCAATAAAQRKVYVALGDDDTATIVADGVLLGVSRDELRRLVQVLGHPRVRRWLDVHGA